MEVDVHRKVVEAEFSGSAAADGRYTAAVISGTAAASTVRSRLIAFLVNRVSAGDSDTYVRTTGVHTNM